MDYFLLPPALYEHATAISRAVYRMSRPDAVRSPEDVTDLYVRPVTHPTTGEVALPLPGLLIPLHPSNVPNQLLDYLASQMTNQQVNQARRFIENNRGTRQDVLGMLATTYWPARIMTEAQMQAAGWFPTEEE